MINKVATTHVQDDTLHVTVTGLTITSKLLVTGQGVMVINHDHHKVTDLLNSWISELFHLQYIAIIVSYQFFFKIIRSLFNSHMDINNVSDP